jgi:hypothetical protein
MAATTGKRGGGASIFVTGDGRDLPGRQFGLLAFGNRLRIGWIVGLVWTKAEEADDLMGKVRKRPLRRRLRRRGHERRRNGSRSHTQEQAMPFRQRKPQRFVFSLFLPILPGRGLTVLGPNPSK